MKNENIENIECNYKKITINFVKSPIDIVFIGFLEGVGAVFGVVAALGLLSVLWKVFQ